MKTLLVVLSMTLWISTAGAAETSDQTLKELTANQVATYAKALYDRHDYVQAAPAFNRALQMDPHNATALTYLEKIQKMQLPEIMCCMEFPAPQLIVAKLADAGRKPYVPVAIDSNEDLKAAIAAEDQALAILKQEINQMRNQTE